MGKYDFALDITSNDSNAIILSHIKPGGLVLEFGPYKGRATKYLKERLNCQVYAVELDPEAAKECSQYTEQIIIGDIETCSWKNEYEHLRFDCIIFADVLEHLRNPEDVLINAKHLLKKDGAIYISIPNITHNSILINMINNKFNYTPTGILDETHVRFWGYDNLLELVYKIGMIPTHQQATYCDMRNEVGTDYNTVSPMLSQELTKRRYGHVYQFVFELKDAEYVEHNNIPIFKDIHGEEQYKYHITLEPQTFENASGDFFIEHKVYDNQKITIDLLNHNTNSIIFTIKNYINQAFLVSIEGISESVTYPISLPNCLTLNNKTCFVNSGQPIIIIFDKSYEQITLSLEKVDINLYLFQELLAANHTLQTEKSNLLMDKQEILARENSVIVKNNTLQNDYTSLSNELEKITCDKEQLVVALATLNQKHFALTEEKEQLQQEIEQCLQEKEDLLQKLQHLEETYQKTQLDNQSLLEDNSSLTNELENLNNSKLIRLWRKYKSE